jgi:hypothetical protein
MTPYDARRGSHNNPKNAFLWCPCYPRRCKAYSLNRRNKLLLHKKSRHRDSSSKWVDRPQNHTDGPKRPLKQTQLGKPSNCLSKSWRRGGGQTAHQRGRSFGLWYLRCPVGGGAPPLCAGALRKGRRGARWLDSVALCTTTGRL